MLWNGKEMVQNSLKSKHLQGVPEKTFFQNMLRNAQNAQICPELPKMTRNAQNAQN